MTAWDPARRFAYRSGEAADGRFIAYEFLIEGRDGEHVLRTYEPFSCPATTGRMSSRR